MRGIRCVVSGIALLLPVSVCAAPSVALTAPLAETRYLAPAAIELAADPVVDEGRTIERVEFLADGAVIGTATQAPWSFSWANVVKGNYNLRARVVDSAGQRDASPVVRIHVRDNTPPKVRISAPEHRYISPGSVPLTATVTDRDDPIAKVEFFNGDALLATLTAEPYSISWIDVPAGTYEVSAKATDALGAVGTSNPFRVRVRDNKAPHVRILTPDNRDTFPAPVAISISLHANDRDDNLTHVELFANGAPLTTFTGAPFEFNWTGMQAGTYALTARATDDLGLTTTSRTVNVTITGAPPTAELKMYFIHVDHLNTPRLIADEQQRTVWQWDQQEPFGASAPDQNPSGIGAFEFTSRLPGQYADTETGLYYNYFRDYDPNIGRYIESDPIGLSGGPNTYSYGVASPLLGSDYFGLCRIEVRFKPAFNLGTWTGAYHAYIVTIDPNGSTPSFYRGGPGGAWSVSNPIWGAIQTNMGPYTAGTPDWETGAPPTVVLLDNDQPCACYDQSFGTTLTNIQNSNIGYAPAFQNSNSTVGTAITQAGFALPSIPVAAPGFRNNLSRYFPKPNRTR